MNWKKWTIITVILLLITVNFTLIFLKDSKVARSKYIDEWRSIQEQNLTLSKQKEGVVAPSEVEHVYFQKGIGDFERFLVQEGEEVQPGTPLFEYIPQNMDMIITQYEAEITKLQKEQAALEDNIDSLRDLERELTRTIDEEEVGSSQESTANIQAQIFEKEYQLRSVEGDIERLGELVSMAENPKDSLIVHSVISGVVKEIRHDLENPVVTITSSEQQIRGFLEEEEMLEINEGMKVNIASKALKNKFEGYITKIAVNPEQEPQVGVKGQYEFVVEFDGVEETGSNESAMFFTGAQVDLEIITKEVEDALTLPKGTIKNGSIYVLMNNGKIEKRKVETGIKVSGIYEIEGGVEAGELVVHYPSNIKDNTHFFTPIEMNKLEKKSLTEMRKKDILKYWGRGLLSN